MAKIREPYCHYCNHHKLWHPNDQDCIKTDCGCMMFVEEVDDDEDV